MRILVTVLAALTLVAPAVAAGDVTMDDVACAGLGAKRPGTAADHAMAQLIRARFRAAGLATRTETFTLPRDDIRVATADQLAPEARSMPAAAFAYSGNGTVAGDVVWVGTGRDSDYAGKDVKDKIVMVERDEVFHRTSQLTQVIAHGGAAMLYVSGSPDNLIQIGAVRFAQEPPAPIPTVTVGAADGAPLIDAAKAGTLKMRLAVAGKRVNAVGRNVIGVQRGSTYPDRYIVVGAHYDSWFDGAVDNCSAAATLLQLADAAPDLHPAYSVIYAAWDAEEVGLVGSSDFVRRHPRIVDATVVNENLEMDAAAADGSSLNLAFGTTSPTLNGILEATGLANGYTVVNAPVTAVRQISGGIIPTDLNEFYARGVQGFSTYASTAYYHTEQDTPDKINPAGHERVTTFAKGVLGNLQTAPPESLAVAREVPSIDVDATPQGEVTIKVLDPAGAPLDGAPVRVVVDHRGWWPTFAGPAAGEGNGVYRLRLPQQALRPGRSWVQATASDTTYLAKNWARVDVPRARIRSVRLSHHRHAVRVVASASVPARWTVTVRGGRVQGTRAVHRFRARLRLRRPLPRHAVVRVRALTAAGAVLTARKRL
jgi:hypothetical protein